MSTIAAPATRSEPRPALNRETFVAGLHVFVPMASVPVGVWALATYGINATDLWLLTILYVVSFLGITVGFHRYLVHRSFRTNRIVEAVLIGAGCLGVSGTPLFWAAGHVQHHQYSDLDDDPHSPRQGLLHAQFLWLVRNDSHPDYERFARRFQNNAPVMRLNALYPVFVIASLGVPALIGGWSGLLWGGLIRIFLVHHIGWLVNSLCHTIGTRPHRTRDDSRNIGLLAPLTMGDSWHNNHHAFPRAAFHGLRWWQFDPSALVIRSLEATGLATDVVRVTPAMQRKSQTATP